MGTNSASVPLKRARTRPMISALSTRVEGSATPGFDKCSSGKLKSSSRRTSERNLRYHTRRSVRAQTCRTNRRAVETGERFEGNGCEVGGLFAELAAGGRICCAPSIYRGPKTTEIDGNASNA